MQANADAICIHMRVMSPGASAKPHYHEAYETAIYMVEGVTEFLHGPNHEYKDRVERALIARTDPNEQESVVLLGS